MSKPTPAQVAAKLEALAAQLREAKSSDDVLRVAFLIHCELKDLVDSK